MSCNDFMFNAGETPQLPMQVLDDSLTPVASSSISTITLDLYWKDSDGTANTINSRSATDVKGASGGAYQSDMTITGATSAKPIVITSAAHGLLSGYTVLTDSVVGMTEINGKVWKITRINDDTFSLNGSSGTGYTAYDSAGIARSGLFTWTATAADTAIQGTVAIGATEQHIAVFTFTLTDGAILKVEYPHIVKRIS